MFHGSPTPHLSWSGTSEFLVQHEAHRCSILMSLIVFFWDCWIDVQCLNWEMSTVVFGGRIDTESLLGRHVKPTKAMVYLVFSFGREVIGFLATLGEQTSLRVFESQCSQVSSCLNKFDHTDWRSESGLCSMPVYHSLLFIGLCHFMGHGSGQFTPGHFTLYHSPWVKQLALCYSTISPGYIVPGWIVPGWVVTRLPPPSCSGESGIVKWTVVFY